MARKKKDTVELTDAELVSAWMKKNKVKKIAPNVGGENVVRSFFVRRKKKAAVKPVAAKK